MRIPYPTLSHLSPSTTYAWLRPLLLGPIAITFLLPFSCSVSLVESDLHNSSISPLPEKPDWATTVETDQYGYYADLSIHGVIQRMRWIAPGSFNMGSSETERGMAAQLGTHAFCMVDEDWHAVILTRGYWIADSLCTQELWASVMGSNPSQFIGDMQRPVETVSWDDAQDFLSKLNKEFRHGGFRLPTEAQWEFACRAGTSTPFYGPSVNELGWYNENSQRTTHPVKRKLPNAWGLYDMVGNVAEWCFGLWGDYLDGSATDPVGAAPHFRDKHALEPSGHIVRGGCWNFPPSRCRSAARDFLCLDGSMDNQTGFRFVSQSGPEPVSPPDDVTVFFESVDVSVFSIKPKIYGGTIFFEMGFSGKDEPESFPFNDLAVYVVSSGGKKYKAFPKKDDLSSPLANSYVQGFFGTFTFRWENDNLDINKVEYIEIIYRGKRVICKRVPRPKR